MCVIAFEFKNNEPLQIVLSNSYDEIVNFYKDDALGKYSRVSYTDKDGRFWVINCHEIVTVNVIKYETN